MLVRRRYYTWLVKAYIKRWKKTIFYSTLLGILIAGVGFAAVTFYVRPFMDKKVSKIGYAGAYKLSNVPEPLLNELSYGLTEVRKDGRVYPKAAERWEIKNKGKEYIFYLKKGQYFHDGEELTADSVHLPFKDIKKKVIDEYTVSYSLDTPYSPFLTTASRPLFRNNLIGLGSYKIRDFELNAGYIKSIVLQKRDDNSIRKTIYFYPTREALKTAFALGEIDMAEDIKSMTLSDTTDFRDWKNVKIRRSTNYDELVIVFFNNVDSELSNKKLRQALNYALPEAFSEGERAFSPIPPTSYYFAETPNYGIVDMEIAQELLKSSQASLDQEFEIITPDDLMPTAKVLQKHWDELGVKTVIKESNEIPNSFQIFLYQIKLPKDPDQYTLWHSDQVNNIGRFKNLRIDKLLEDGRVTFDVDKRQAIYSDFQKYLIDEVPAIFLYFPTNFTLVRG